MLSHTTNATRPPERDHPGCSTRGTRALQSGFTLIELLVVMAIILILIGIAVPGINSARNKAKDTEVKAGVNTVQKALEQHAVDHSGFYPGAQWLTDSTGNLHVGPGVIGATPTFINGESQDDFTVPEDKADPRVPYLPVDNTTPNPEVLDSLVVNGYLSAYPANPFIRATGGARSQMTNLFLFNPILNVSTPDPSNPQTLDWDKLTTPQTDGLRHAYTKLMAGHFSYIPLNPQNITGFDYTAQWTSLPAVQLTDFYKRCRGYVLVGWGHSRLDETQTKGLTDKYWNTTLGGLDFDKNLDVDPLEKVLSDTTAAGLLYNEMKDTSGSVGAYGQPALNGGKNIDPAFSGAASIIISGS